MATPVLATKLFVPPPRPQIVLRPRLSQRLDQGLHAGHKLTLISAPAGFGKTSLLSEWVHRNHSPRVAWLSLDEADNDPARFLAYLVAAVQTIAADLGAGVVRALQSPQPPPPEAVLTSLLNELTSLPTEFALVLDDYHVIEANAVDQALSFVLEHRPPQMHLVVATREDPDLPLARWRARGQLTELRSADLRFTPTEAAEFLNRVMGLNLAPAEVAALDDRTEGWIAGLQLAALSMQGQKDTAGFIQAFTGSHQFVLDYLVAEVLQRQPEAVQTFLLRTSILERMCEALCEAVVGEAPSVGQPTLEYLEHANLFIVPLDHERRWYRYHHLFADLLRQRLAQRRGARPAPAEGTPTVAELHIRASQWYEANSLPIEAFQHAAAAGDVERAARLVATGGMPLHLREAVITVLHWLESLPRSVLDARPALWVNFASLLLVVGRTIGVEEKLQAAEAALALRGAGLDDTTRYLYGQMAASRSVVALTRYDVEAMLAQSHRALELLHPSHAVGRSSALWAQGYAYILRGERAAARRAFTEAVALSQAAGAVFTVILATIGLGLLQEADNHLHAAAETYRRILHLAGDQPLQIVMEAHLGLARIYFEWNDLAAAEHHGRQSLDLARQYEPHIDRYVICEVFLARLKLAQGDLAGAALLLAQTDQAVRQNNFVHRAAEVAATRVLVLLRQGQAAAAAGLALAHDLPLSQARALVAQGKAGAALAALATRDRQAEAQAWPDEQLRVRVLQALAYQALAETGQALDRLREALALAEPGGFVRLFVDEGAPMGRLLAEAAARGIRPEYVGKLLAAVGAEPQPALAASPAETDRSEASAARTPAPPLIEPLSQRELEVLRLMAQGLSNSEISERLFLALSTVKGHNQRIFDKLHVQRRTEAVARARELGLI